MSWAPHTSQLLGRALVFALISTATATAAPKPTGGRPIARIKESVICCPREDVYLDGWASIDVRGEVVEWLWDFTEDGVADTMSTTGEMIVPAPVKSSSYSVILTVRDNEGNLSAPDTATVHVMNTAPRVSMRSDTTVKVRIRVRFHPEVSWVCSEPSRYEWDFGNDGTAEYHSPSNGNTSKVYYTPGRYLARFRVVDGLGNEGGALTTIRVVDTHAQVREAARESAADSDQSADRM
jgi:hypothetical protein